MIVILAAIPIFFILIGIELWQDHKKQTGYYRFNDAINSLQLGILSRISGVLLGLIPFTFYVYFYQNWRIFDLPQDSLYVWALAFIGYDLVYYWVHRLSHTINVMWGSHVVHHSSEEYNLTTALRQTSTPAIFAWMIVAPLAMLGISPEVLAISAALNLVYQFWVHTRHIDKMPAWYEAIFVTPSHHRVHHALNRDYIDKNFAGVLILWDKLFNTFQAEKEDMPVVFGISSQLKSWNPLWANFQVYRNLWQDFKVTRSWKDKIKVWFSPPSWRPDDAKQINKRKYATTKNMVKYEVSLTTGQQSYILFQHIVTIAFTFAWLLSLSKLTTELLLLSCSFGIFSLYVISSLQENKSFAMPLEVIRIALMTAIIWVAIPWSQFIYAAAFTSSFAILTTAWLIMGYRPAHIANRKPTATNL